MIYSHVGGVNMNAISYKQHAIEERWDAIVVGSGIGGLAAAALLARYGGKRVLVLERHYAVGGYTHTFHRPGYEWDVGVHYVGRNAAVRAVFDHLTGGALEWQAMPDVYDRILMGGHSYELATGVENFRARMEEYFPGEEAAIDRYLAAVRAAAKAQDLYFAEKAIPRPLAAVAGGLMRAPFLRWADRTTAEVLREITGNRELLAVLTAQWADYGLPPEQSSFGIHATIANHYLEGAMYPVGGAARIAETIAPTIERNGGQIVASAEVMEILLEGGRAAGVRMADGRMLRAPLVVSDAGVRNTFGRLIGGKGAGFEAARAEIAKARPSMAHLSLYVGVKQTAEELGLSGTNLWAFPGPDHDGNLKRFEQDPEAPFPVLFVSFPSAKDPEFARRHPGRATLEVVAPAPYDWFEKWEGSRWKRRDADYDEFKQALARRMQSELERLVPAIAGRIDYAELSTPLTTRHFMNYERGEAYGLSATPERFRMRCLTPRTPARGLYLTGQDVVSLGVTGALMGGVISASAILGKNLAGKVMRPA
ncbi:MAG TPA: NAD(P)/FAD-dependent oxidoreductase [Bryobacteraceae bacterium]|nr:NAD(P)/FAD-dependent oxidoreductase [Bryobacteraceae bacterium]